MKTQLNIYTVFQILPLQQCNQITMLTAMALLTLFVSSYTHG